MKLYNNKYFFACILMLLDLGSVFGQTAISSKGLSVRTVHFPKSDAVGIAYIYNPQTRKRRELTAIGDLLVSSEEELTLTVVAATFKDFQKWDNAEKNKIDILDCYNLDITNYNYNNIIRVCENGNIKELRISYVAIDKEGIDALLKITHLKILIMAPYIKPGTSLFPDSCLDNLQHQKLLTKLILRSFKITDVFFRHLNALNNLKIMQLGDCELIGDFKDKITGCKQIETISLVNMNLAKFNFKMFSELNVYRVFVGHCVLSSQTIDSLTAMEKIQELDLSGTNIGDEEFAPLAKLHGVRKLFLSGTKITNRSMSLFQSMTRLESLDLSATAITPVGLRYLRVLSNLKELYVSENQIGDEAKNNLKKEMPGLSIVVRSK